MNEKREKTQEINLNQLGEERMLSTDFIPARQGGSRYLMLVMHGLGDSMEGYRSLVPELGIPEMNYLLINAPDHYVSGFSWYDIYENPEPGIIRSRKLLIDLLDHQNKEGFEYDHMFLFGFSQGCLMAVETGARCEHTLGGIIGISGYVQNPEALVKEKSEAAESQNFLITHGNADDIIPIEKSRPTFQYLSDSGLNIKWEEFSKAHSFEGEREFQVIRDFVNQSIKSIESNTDA